MILPIKILSVLVALEFFYILYLETFATTSATTARVFGMDPEELSRPSVQTLFKNQGVYNGLIGVLVLLAALVFTSKIAVMLLMGTIVLVALYGSLTSSPSILFKQGGLAIVTLILCAVL
jgi:putative membrane protein